jgi:mannose/fructose/N-acetylgalactosamine-specific phosphotransferase system component IIC
MLIFQAFLLAVLAGFAQWDSRIGGQNMLDRPLITGPIVGLILGDVTTGVIVGGTLELVFMGIVNIGGATPPDIVTGGILGTAFAILSGLDPESAVAIALPIALFAQSLGILARVINTTFNHQADAYAEAGDWKGIEKILWAGAFLFFAFSFTPVFLGVAFGSEIVASIVSALPQVIMTGLRTSSGLLPALGMAILMRFIYDNSSAPYLFLGFVLSAFLGMSLIGVAIVGAIAAGVYYQTQVAR